MEPSEATEAANRLEAEQGLTAEDEWFEQVLQQLQESDDPQRLQLVLDAIREHEFTLSLEVEGEAVEPTSNYAPEASGKWFELTINVAICLSSCSCLRAQGTSSRYGLARANWDRWIQQRRRGVVGAYARVRADVRQSALMWNGRLLARPESSYNVGSPAGIRIFRCVN